MATATSEITDVIRRELAELTKSIGRMMETFRQIRQPIQESSEKVPRTTRQLERVTQQTEQATHRVLDIVEALTARESEIKDWATQMVNLAGRQEMMQLGQLADRIRQHAEANLNDTMVIMEALQFQDITAQQILHAVSQLEDVETKLQSLLKTTGSVGGKEESPPVGNKKAFDPNAAYPLDHHTQQQDVDDIISSMKKSG